MIFRFYPLALAITRFSFFFLALDWSAEPAGAGATDWSAEPAAGGASWSAEAAPSGWD